jgi:hypothetical protein
MVSALRRGRPLGPPLHARRSPGTAIALGPTTEAVSMARAPADGLGVAAWVDPRPPHTLVVPLAPQSRLVVAVAEKKWQRLSLWLARRQMVLALRRGRLGGEVLCGVDG